MKSDRHYVRVYDDDLRRDYPQIWRDDKALSTWLRLLSLADKMWPTSPELPRTAGASSLAVLAESGLVELLPDHCYRIRGHDAERTARSNAASNAAASRWGNAGGNAEVMPRRERDENETNTPPPQVGKRANGTNPRALGTNPRAQGTSPRQELQREKRDPTSIHEILERSRR
jgi:hypothetical protein